LVVKKKKKEKKKKHRCTPKFLAIPLGVSVPCACVLVSPLYYKPSVKNL